MIETRQELPALSASWLAPLKTADPKLYAMSPGSIVIEWSADRFSALLPADAPAVLSTVDLRGKEIGAFRFAPAPSVTSAEQIGNYDRGIRRQFELKWRSSIHRRLRRRKHLCVAEGRRPARLGRRRPEIAN